MIKKLSFFQNGYWLHPLLLAIYFLLNVWYDSAKISFTEVVGTFITVVLLLAIIWGILGLLRWKNRRNISLLVTPLAGLLLNAVYVQANLLHEQIRFRTTLGITLFVILMIALRLRKVRELLSNAHTYLVILILGWSLFLGYRWFSYPKEIITPPILEASHAGEKDVYLLVMDAYAATPNLQKYWNHSNKPFLDSLGSRGFHLVKNSHTTYNMTRRVMSTMLNVNYLNSSRDLARSDEVLLPFIPGNASSKLFKAKNYNTCWYSLLQETEDDFRNGVYIFPMSFTHYAAARSAIFYIPFLISKVPGYPVEKPEPKYKRLMKRMADFQTFLKDSSAARQFGYYHSELSHENYVVNKKGFDPDAENRPEMEAYGQTLVYHEGHILELVRNILSRRRPCIILIMSDHGHRWIKNIPRSEADKEGFENFMCVYETGQHYGDWYEGVTPVNAWRIVLNHTFGTALPLLPDHIGIYE
ncbi:hypothetical protein [Siphonobacter aquaeclarae]|uniref:Sulfatase n=1 Tax=Siphonobacter aquaeclarae TaxID=563176 RepID=A0A1G9PVK3_9BACT|nr:hypothetical protein [Siphonobacter aquaeclarae]SDM02521.1 hypothetical protein SAMN04488090_2332 [Siphonobacter aquaeclarae]